jgi:hypothetical protein
MIKITDQYFWNLVFLLFYGFLLVMAVIILETESRIALAEITLFDLSLIVLAAWRLTHFFSSDHTTKFLREQLYDLKPTTKSLSLEKPKTGPRRALIDLISSSYSFGLAMTSLVTFFYLLTTYAFYPVVILALSGAVAIIQILVLKLAVGKEVVE